MPALNTSTMDYPDYRKRAQQVILIEMDGKKLKQGLDGEGI
jgi:hypothetical protein